MQAEVFPITDLPGIKLAIMPRPRAGDWLEDEVASWRRSGIDVVVSLLQDEEIAELGLDREGDLCRTAGLRFVQLGIPDRGVPSSSLVVTELVQSLRSELRAGRGVGIHCRMGVGRSAMMAVCVLAVLGTPLESAWQAVSAARRLAVPDTTAQRNWVSEWFTSFNQAEFCKKVP
jgi:protein-tyrosine phosphatase